MTDFSEAIAKLEIKPGDVVLVKGSSSITGMDVVNLRLSFPAGHFMRTCPFIRVRDFDDLRTLSEEGMNRAGWFRKETP